MSSSSVSDICTKVVDCIPDVEVAYGVLTVVLSDIGLVQDLPVFNVRSLQYPALFSSLLSYELMVDQKVPSR